MGIIRNLWGKIGSQYSFSKTETPFRVKLSLALSTSSASLSMVFIGNIFVKFYTDIIKMDPVLVGGIYYWISIWSALCGILIGYFMDRLKFHPQKGKYVRVLKRMAPVILISIAAMALVSPALPEKVIAVLFVVELMIYYLAMGLYTAAYNCYNLLAAPTKEDRIDLGVLVAFISNFVSFFATLIPNLLLVGNDSMPRERIVFFLMMVLLMNSALYFFGLKRLEDKAELYSKGSADKQNVNVKTLWSDIKGIVGTRAYWAWFVYMNTAFAPMSISFTMFLFMMDHVIHATGVQSAIVDALPMVVVLILLPFIANTIKKTGGKNGIFMSMIPFICGQIILFLSHNWIMALAAYFLIWLGLYGANTAAGPLGAALIDENERRTDIRKTGLFGSLYSILNMPFMGIWTLVFMSLIKKFGYIQGAAEQSAQAQMGIRMASTLLPVALCLIGIIPLALFPINKKVETELSEYSRMRRSNEDASPQV